MNSSTNSNETYSDVTSMATIRIAMYSSILVWSLLGNILVIVVIFKNSSLKTNFNYLIVNMAASDLVIPCLALPMRIVDTKVRHLEWLVEGPFGNFLCKMCYFVADISPAVSAFSLVIIAVNRFFAIAFPMRGRLSKTKTLTLIAGTWIFAMVLLSPYLYTFRISNESGWTTCQHNWSPAFHDGTAEAIFIIIVTAVVFAIPCFANTILYTLMLCKLKQNSKNMVYMLNQEQYKRRQRKDKNILIMTIVIMLLFLLLWGPFFCTLTAVNFFVNKSPENIHSIQTAMITVQLLGFLNSAVNPWVYFYFLKNIRQGAKRLLRNSLRRSSTESTMQITIRTRATSLRHRASTMKTSEL